MLKKNSGSGTKFKRNVFTLMMGTLVAQAIPIAVSPILTRLYSPGDFGMLTLFVSVFAVLSAISALRYELAIMQPELDEDAVALVVLSLIITAGFCSALVALITLFGDRIVALLGIQGGTWLYFIPLGVFFGGAVQALGYWHSRHQRFQRISQGKIAQGMATVGIQCGANSLALGSGLISGYVGGLGISLFVFCRGVWKNEKDIFKKVTFDSLRRNARTYKDFPKYSVIGALADNASLQMPVFILNRFFDAHSTGCFGLTFRVLNLPMALAASSLSQVLYQRLSTMQYSEPEAVRSLILKIFLLLLVAMVPVIGVAAFFGEPLFALVFGEPWRVAGSMAGVLVFAVAIRFAVSPLSSVLALSQNIRLGVIWQTTYFFTISITLYIFSDKSLDLFLRAFVVHEMFLYGFYLYLILRGSELGKLN